MVPDGFDTKFELKCEERARRSDVYQSEKPEAVQVGFLLLGKLQPRLQGDAGRLAYVACYAALEWVWLLSTGAMW